MAYDVSMASSIYPEMFSRKKLYTQSSNEDDALVDDALIDVVKVSDT